MRDLLSNMSGKKLVIELTGLTTENYLRRSVETTELEANADMEPSGSVMQIMVSSVAGLPSSVYLLENDNYVEIGEANVDLRTTTENN